MDNLSLMMKCKETGTMKFWTKVFYETTKLEAEAGVIDDPVLKRKYEYLMSLRENQCNYVLLTIRPKVITVPELLSLTAKVVKKKWLSGCEYVYEQKGESDEDMGKGAHVHILCKQSKQGDRNKTKCSMIKEVWDTCSRLGVDVLENCINVKLIPKKDLGQVQMYLKGEKKDDKKSLACEYDVRWRAKHGLNAIYRNDLNST